MKTTLYSGLLVTAFFFLLSCNSQTKTNHPEEKRAEEKLIGGGCDGCEIMYVGMPTNIKSVDTSKGWTEKGHKLLVKGTVYQLDGKTPAPNVIIYYWQTDNDGYYSPKPGMNEDARKHGYIRGWLKSDEKGNYALYTIRPAPYPNENMPAHIHISIKEPDISNEYYTDELVFDDDKLLIEEKRKRLENRCGSGILKTTLSNGIQTAEHNFILGLNIPDYPKK